MTEQVTTRTDYEVRWFNPWDNAYQLVKSFKSKKDAIAFAKDGNKKQPNCPLIVVKTTRKLMPL